MRGFFGWFSGQPRDDGDAALRSMLAAGQVSTTAIDLRTTAQAAMAVFGSPALPTLVEQDGFLLALSGHPRLHGARAGAVDVAQLSQALRTQGKDALSDISGAFSLAAWDTRTKRGLLAVDRIGVQRLVYGRSGDALAFASTLDLLGGYPGIHSQVSGQGIFDYLFYHVSPGPRTIFADQHRVPPGHYIEFNAGRVSEPQAYWSMQFEEGLGRNLGDIEKEFLSLLETSVKDAAEGASVGSFLSGGTDSSTVCGMLARMTDGRARTFSIGFDVKGYDEMEYARIAAKHFDCEHHTYYVTPADVVNAVPKIAASYDEPFGNASAIPTYYCAKLAHDHGVTRLLAGDGGDELFGGNERYAKQNLLGLYQRIPSALRAALIEPVLMHTPGVQHVLPLRKLRRYVEQARPPMPLRYESYNLLMHLGLKNVFTPEFLATIDVDHPHKLMAEAHAPYANVSLINQMLGIDLRLILADGDLPKVTHMCALADVDVAFPLLDERLIDFSRKLPADMKLRGTKLRWFFKHALRDFLPPAVISKQKHGFGLPVGAWLVKHKPLFDLAADSIALLRQRGIVQPRFIDELLDSRLREHAAYFGTMAWVLMMLGLWLDSRKL